MSAELEKLEIIIREAQALYPVILSRAKKEENTKLTKKILVAHLKYLEDMEAGIACIKDLNIKLKRDF